MGQILGGIIRPRLSTLSLIVVIVFKLMILFEAEELLLSNQNVVQNKMDFVEGLDSFLEDTTSADETFILTGVCILHTICILTT